MNIQKFGGVQAESLPSKSPRKLSVKVNSTSQRSQASYSSVDSQIREISEMQRKSSKQHLPISPSKFNKDSTRKLGGGVVVRNSSVGLGLNIANMPKRKEFGDARPLVKDVWFHYPVQEVEALPKDTREALNVILKIKSKVSSRVQKTQAEDKSSNSLIEEKEETEKELDKLNIQMVPCTKGPTSAHTKINNQTMLKSAIGLEQLNDPINREINLARKLEEQSDNCSYNFNNSRFQKIGSINHKKFKIGKNSSPKGVINGKIWKILPISPHLGKNLMQPSNREVRKKLDSLSPLLNNHTAANSCEPTNNNKDEKLTDVKNRMIESVFKRRIHRTLGSRRDSIEPSSEVSCKERIFKKGVKAETSKFSTRKFAMRPNALPTRVIKKITAEALATVDALVPDYSKINEIDARLIEEVSQHCIATLDKSKSLDRSGSEERFSKLGSKHNQNDFAIAHSKSIPRRVSQDILLSINTALSRRNTKAGHTLNQFQP